jgi:hypothetical protein
MATKATVEGAAELSASFRRASSDLEHMNDSHSRVGGFVVTQAKMAAPRRTGRLAGSIRATATGSDVTIGSGLIYAGVIHNGWPRHGITANPFLRVPAERTQGSWINYYDAEVDRIVGRIHGK